jgi:FAD synthetase
MRSVMVFGTFDILHMGHIHLFQQARLVGDHLIVVVARSVNVENVKGRYPINTDDDRRDLLLHIDLVDEAVLGGEIDVYEIVGRYKPDTILLGYDQTAFVDRLEEKLQELSPATMIRRATPFAKNRHKSQKIKDYIMSNI